MVAGKDWIGASLTIVNARGKVGYTDPQMMPAQLAEAQEKRRRSPWHLWRTSASSRITLHFIASEARQLMQR